MIWKYKASFKNSASQFSGLIRLAISFTHVCMCIFVWQNFPVNVCFCIWICMSSIYFLSLQIVKGFFMSKKKNRKNGWQEQLKLGWENNLLAVNWPTLNWKPVSMKCYFLTKWQPFKNYEKCFFFHLKEIIFHLFIPKIFKLLLFFNSFPHFPDSKEQMKLE